MNDPINYCDPSGHFTIAALLISIGISLVFEVIEDIMGDGKLGGDKDGWDYLGAGIAGFFRRTWWRLSCTSNILCYWRTGRCCYIW